MKQSHYNELMKIAADLETEGDGAIAKSLRAALAHTDAAQAPKKPYGYVLGGNYWTADELTAKQVSVRTGSNYLPIYAAPVAPAAAAPINLEGLRKKLLTPREIVRDEDGYLTHPDFPICDEGTHAGKFLDAFGIDAEFVAMESDDPEAAERYFEAGEMHCSYWTPTPPEGEGWLLLEIYETEDGPCALFGRDRYEAENALKRQRMRAQLDRIKQLEADKGAAQ